MKTRLTLFFIVALIYISQATMFAQTTLYVSPTGGNTPPYATLGDAATNIQDAVDAASTGDLVLVDDGTYVLSSNVSITKGITVRSINGYSAAIVDGNNATRCFYINHADAVLDGFTIQNGYNPSSFGGGVNIVTGGTVQNCYITGSQARDGGGVAIDNSGLVNNSIITGNLAFDNGSSGYGGGVRLLNGGTVRGSIIYGNTSQVYGGGVNIWSAGTVENCTIVDNTAPNGAGIRARNNSTIINSVIYFNNGANWETNGSGYTFDYSCSTPALPAGTGNTTDDPLFENIGSNDFHLTSSSTLINAGLNYAWMSGALDLDGNDRILESNVDIGAYEYLAASITPVSDGFYPETTLQSPWTFYDPVGDATLTFTGTNAEIAVPSGTSHDLYTGSGNQAPRLLQPAPDTDFQVVVKFESVPSSTYQLQGIVVQESNTKFIRFGSYYGNGPKFFVAVIDGNSIVQTPGVTTVGAIPQYLRVTRSVDNWTYEYSTDNSTWNNISTFTQAFTVNEVGFYAGNAGGNPAFTASADFFWNTADVGFTDTDTQVSTPPTIDIWYGDTQSFGNLGNPQQWVNILGRVADDNGVASLTYSLNGAPGVPLAIGPNGTRLIGNGDFETEIDHADLIAGANTVEFTATDALGAQTTKTVTINYSAVNVWPLPYTADWTTISTMDSINNIANIADGLWELTPAGIHTVETGYDRLIVLGDETWTSNYEVTAEMTIHSAQSGSGVGFAIGWQGHTGTASPRTNWPLEAIGWVRDFNSLRILTYDTGIEAQQSVTMSLNTKYLLKCKSEDIGGGQSKFSVKIWEDGTTEPAAYMITSDIANRDGSVLLITHKADVTWGTIQIDPLSGNTPPQFTSTPVTIGEEGQVYTYNITASDPNTSDVLTITAPTLPSWLSFTDNGGGSATLTGTPSAANLGANIVELLVSDGNGGSDIQNFTITVTTSGGSLPISDQFCGTSIEPYWTIFDPFAGNTGESTFGINSGALEISIPSGTSHDLSTNSAPRVLQSIPDADFGVEVKFNSVPSAQYQMQGIIVEGTGYRLRFETYFGTAPTFYANGYGVSFGTAVNQAIGGAIPSYLRVVRTGNDFAFDYSYDGTTWTNIVTRSITVAVTEVGFYGANHNPNPAFTVSAEYFRNVNDPIPTCSVVDVTAPNGGEVWTGGSTQNITWTSTDVTNVNIEFSSDNGANWNTVATSVAAATGTFSFSVPNISSTLCLVRVSDTDNASIFDVSDNTFTINAAVVNPTITIGSSTTVAGSYVTIPIDLTAPSGFKIDYLLQGKIHFDATKLKFLYGGYDPGMLVNDFGWTGTFYSALAGTVDVILSGATPVNTSGTLFYLTFQVIDGSTGSVNLTSSTAEWPVDVLEAPLTVVNGSVAYSAGSGTSTNRGDATLNYIVDIYDALAVIYHWVGFAPLTGQAFTNADTDFDGDVDIDDYLRIIFFVYLHDWDFAFPSVSPSSSVAMGGAGFESSEIISIPLELSNSDNVQSVEVGFDFDQGELEYVNTISNSMGNVNIKSAVANGKLSLVVISTEEIQNGTVATVRFKKLKSNSSSNISTTYELNNGKASGNGMLSIGAGTVTDVKDGDSEIPTKFELSQNYPNPFNPTTVIKFAVPKAGNYHLSVYNILGQKIMSLVDDQLQAGFHSVTFDGARVASGIYIYSLEGENVNISRKMLLIK